MWKIYKITNKIYNEKEKCYKSYIGMTLRTVEERFKEHCESGDCKTFNAAIKKYGKDNCNSCDTLKETTKYRRDNSTNDGFKSDCKDCLCKKELIRYYQRKEKLNNGS